MAVQASIVNDLSSHRNRKKLRLKRSKTWDSAKKWKTQGGFFDHTTCKHCYEHWIGLSFCFTGSLLILAMKNGDKLNFPVDITNWSLTSRISNIWWYHCMQYLRYQLEYFWVILDNTLLRTANIAKWSSRVVYDRSSMGSLAKFIGSTKVKELISQRGEYPMLLFAAARLKWIRSKNSRRSCSGPRERR